MYIFHLSYNSRTHKVMLASNYLRCIPNLLEKQCMF